MSALSRGERVRNARHAHGMSQVAVGRQCGCAAQLVSAMELDGSTQPFLAWPTKRAEVLRALGLLVADPNSTQRPWRDVDTPAAHGPREDSSASARALRKLGL